ncbi:MAG: hypothetical protein PHI98_05585 [Eubacteriales bacterium]|nr:hypothetical protein [Eubacteriales bacterium]
MMKHLLKTVGIGAAIGLAANQIISYIVSSALHLGYYMAYPAALPEYVGGEMNAVALQMIGFALLGAGIAAAFCIGRHRLWRMRTRVIGVAASVAVSILPITLIATNLLG